MSHRLFGKQAGDKQETNTSCTHVEDMHMYMFSFFLPPDYKGLYG